LYRTTFFAIYNNKTFNTFKTQKIFTGIEVYGIITGIAFCIFVLL